MRISDWSSDVCSSDLQENQDRQILRQVDHGTLQSCCSLWGFGPVSAGRFRPAGGASQALRAGNSPPLPAKARGRVAKWVRSEEHTSELQSLMRISYAVFCLKKKTTQKQTGKHR